MMLLIIFCIAIASLDTSQDESLYCARQQMNRIVLILQQVWNCGGHSFGEGQCWRFNTWIPFPTSIRVCQTNKFKYKKTNPEDCLTVESRTDIWKKWHAVSVEKKKRFDMDLFFFPSESLKKKKISKIRKLDKQEINYRKNSF